MKHYQKFTKYQRIYWRNISVGNLRSTLPTDTFPSVIQSVTTDGPFSIRNSVGNYRRKIFVGIYRLNYGRKSFRIKKKTGRWRGGFGELFFFRRIQKDSPYNDVTGSPFKMPTESPRDLKWQIRTVTCLCVRQNHRQSFRRWNRRKKLIYVSSADPLLPYFSFFFLIPTLPICKQPAPPKKNLPHISTTSYISWSFVVTASVFWFTDGFYQFL